MNLWQSIAAFLSVSSTAFTILGYPMSYIEVLGTVFNLWSVWLAAKKRVSTWPIGNIGVVFFLMLFYQINLYSDMVEQVYYLVIGFYGWWAWQRDEQRQVAALIGFSARSNLIGWGCTTLVLGLLLGMGISKVHLMLPTLFPEPASYPYLDALTTVASFVATWLMAKRRIECWLYWIAIDMVGIALYYSKEVYLLAILYCIFLVMASNGLHTWVKQWKLSQKELLPTEITM